MSFEKLALFGIIIFAFMALAQGLRTVREAKKLQRKTIGKRPRRLVASEPVAAEIAESLLRDVAEKYPDLVAEAMETRTIPPKLDKEIKKALNHYLGRVNSKFKGLFYLKTNEVILGREDID